MLSQEHHQQWQKIQQMTEQLHELSANESWQEMIDLESQRQTMIKDYFAVPVSAEEAADIADNIRKILHSDEQLMAFSQRKKDDARVAVQKLSTNRKAIKAYNQFEK